MCTRSRVHGGAIILAIIILLWRIRCCRSTTPDACNVAADGRELLCRGASLFSVRPIYDVDVLRAVIPDNVTKM